MKRIVDITQDGQHLSRSRGFLVVSKDHAEIGRIPLDEILALIVHAHGVTYSNSLLTQLSEGGAITVLCGSNHFPIAYITPLDGHHSQGGRIDTQIGASAPLKKQIWKQLVIQKIKMQAAVLDAYTQPNARLLTLAKTVKSGDPNNIEAQAARHYWSLLMDQGFTRDRSAEGANALLNYGYTVLRAAVARAVIGVGLHPSIGVHHRNQTNAFALADDLIEPFRPLVDSSVRGMLNNDISSVTPEAKQILTRILTIDMDLGHTRSPVTSAITQLCQSAVQSFESGRSALMLPQPPSPLELRTMGDLDVQS